jgi:regulator of RNase E activity RraA
LPLPEDDGALLALIARKLFTAVVGDVLDRMGHTRQFLPAEIQPLDRAMVLAGRARTVKLERVADESDRDYGLLFEALDSLRPGEVFLAGGDCPDAAVWGELMTTRALKLGAAGAVLDGPSRDTRGILRLRFPVFARGSYGQDQAGRAKVTAYRTPLRLGQALVEDGDLIIGDADGVIAVPRAVETETLEKALEKAGAENTLLADLQAGMSAVEAFRKHGIF